MSAIKIELIILILCSVVGFMCGQNSAPLVEVSPDTLRSGLSTATGNFSLEVLYHTSKSTGEKQNLVISPITIWTVLTVIAEGATANTYTEIRKAARLYLNEERMRNAYKSTMKWLIDNSTTVELEQANTIFADNNALLERDYQDLVKTIYNAQVIAVNASEPTKTADLINQYVKQITRGRISGIVDENSIVDMKMLLASGLYFKGQWSSPFNKTLTQRKPFYDADFRAIGEVNMMYNRFTYPFANIRELQARVIELPYGVENRLSMLIMLPNTNVTLDKMFLNFISTGLSFDKVFHELKISREEYGDDEVDCFIPRFKIESSLRLEKALKDMGIHDLFDPKYASLFRMSRTPLHVTRVQHKAEIEVTEEGTIASAITAAEFANRIGVIRFEANRPFAYMIVEKTTNTIVFGGLYQQPTLY